MNTDFQHEILQRGIFSKLFFVSKIVGFKIGCSEIGFFAFLKNSSFQKKPVLFKTSPFFFKKAILFKQTLFFSKKDPFFSKKPRSLQTKNVLFKKTLFFKQTENPFFSKKLILF